METIQFLCILENGTANLLQSLRMSEVEYNREEILREYRPLWKNPQTQEAAMRLEYLLKRKRWEPVNRKAQAAINLERLLRKAPQNHPVKSVVWNVHKKCFVVSLVNPIPSTGSAKRRIRATVGELLTASAVALRRLLMKT